ncbi:MAG TPA: hypothetical protein DER09_04635 [Prolixibacteraceae bacterium]|nr:hypothetical protein [Prolixibacteraceae bacterium]
MKTEQLIHVCGSIVKEESIVPVTAHIAEHTVVAEANKPYSDYYGIAPFNMPTKPNSLFLFTAQYYMLEEALRFARLIDMSCMQSLNIAVSVLNFGTEHYPAIRIKHFPDYQKIDKLQQCFMEQGVEFARKVHLHEKAVIKTSKCFMLERIGDNLYLDHGQTKTGYVALPRLINNDDYNEVLANIRNNSHSPLFDAVRGAIILDGIVNDIVRIYTEHITPDLLRMVQKQFEIFELEHVR